MQNVNALLDIRALHAIRVRQNSLTNDNCINPITRFIIPLSNNPSVLRCYHSNETCLALQFNLIIKSYNIAVCDSLNCANSGQCEVQGGNARCQCTPGYSGPTCETCKEKFHITFSKVKNIVCQFEVIYIYIYITAVCDNFCKNGGRCSVSNLGTAECNCGNEYGDSQCNTRKLEI